MKKLLFITIVLSLSFIYISCSKDSNPVNSTPSDKPVVEIISPTTDTEFHDTVTVEAKASDDKGIVKVEIFIDDSLRATLTVSPYVYKWDTRALIDSSVHTIFAKAYDADTNQVSSKTISVAKVFLAPSDFSVSVTGNSQLKLSWKDNSNYETGFEIEQSTDRIIFTKVSTVTSNTTTAALTIDNSANIYYYRLRAITASKYSSYSTIFQSRLPFAAMKLVEGGTFTMGSSGADTLHSVTVNSYYISNIEVTEGQWKSVMGYNPGYYSALGDNAPIENITWYECVRYCNKLSIKEGRSPAYSVNGITNPDNWPTDTASLNKVIFDTLSKGYRLPTEAEWEYAAKGGSLSKGFIYSGFGSLDSVAINKNNSAKTLHFIGTRTGNELGLYDMSGNVWEWCWDWSQAYTSAAQLNPLGAKIGKYRAMRGGSWLDVSATYFQSNYRVGHAPINLDPSIGFRVVCSK